MGAGYELLDSGGLLKLERYGDRTLVRPSSICVWDRRLDREWNDVDAEYEPGRGWIFPRQNKFETWNCEIEGVTLELRLQSNGQIGLFPEHANYQSELRRIITKLQSSGIKKPHVLNLFAYTGLASLVAVKAGCEVSHIDLSKKALTWAKQNLELNSISSGVRLIPEDAVTFLKRLKKRGESPDIIIADPPSFSRVSKDSTWTIESVLRELLDEMISVVNKKQGAIFFTNHSTFFIHEIVRNLFFDAMKQEGLRVEASSLLVPETNSHRNMPSGSLVTAEW